MHRIRSPIVHRFIASINGDRIKPINAKPPYCAFPVRCCVGPHRSFRSKIRVTIERERERERDPFVSRGRSNLGRAKQSRPRNRGVGRVRKGRDGATGREIFGGGRGSSMVGGRVFGWASLGRYRVVSPRVRKRNDYSCFLLASLLFSPFSLGNYSNESVQGLYNKLLNIEVGMDLG